MSADSTLKRFLSAASARTLGEARNARVIEAEPEIAAAVEALLDLASARHYDSASDETFTECRVCGEWEGHRDGCFVPALQAWAAGPRAV